MSDLAVLPEPEPVEHAGEVGCLLDEAHHQTQRADEALDAGDQQEAHDRLLSARALMSVAIDLLDDEGEDR